jgi:hypothetical protein
MERRRMRGEPLEGAHDGPSERRHAAEKRGRVCLEAIFDRGQRWPST